MVVEASVALMRGSKQRDFRRREREDMSLETRGEGKLDARAKGTNNGGGGIYRHSQVSGGSRTPRLKEKRADALGRSRTHWLELSTAKKDWG